MPLHLRQRNHSNPHLDMLRSERYQQVFYSLERAANLLRRDLAGHPGRTALPDEENSILSRLLELQETVTHLRRHAKANEYSQYGRQRS